MLLFQWERVDWLSLMPLEVTVLILLIVIFRVFRRLTRWGPIFLTHVGQETWKFNGHTGELYFRRIPCIESLIQNSNQTPRPNSDEMLVSADHTQYSRDEHSPRLLLVPPLGKRLEKGDPLATALTVLGWDVIVWRPRHVLGLAIQNQPQEAGLHAFCREFRIQHVVVFDYAIMPLLRAYGGGQSDRPPEANIPPLHWIFIRPTFSWGHIDFQGHFLPFTGPWFSRLYLQKFIKICPSMDLPAAKAAKKAGLSSEAMLQAISGLLPGDPCHYGTIWANEGWLTQEAQEAMDQWEASFFNACPERAVRIGKGDWSFFGNETVVIGHIAQLLFDGRE